MMNKRERYSNQDQWNTAFKKGGQWETDHGRRQTRLFAEAFCKQTRIDLESGQSLLDCGCALGDAFPVFARRFPNARLHGCDLSSVAIQRCNERFSDLASFSVTSMEEISGVFDVIYSSNTFEHFTDYEDKARILLQHCRYLCILVPYNEQLFGKDLEYDPYGPHVVTFRADAFDFLLEEGRAKQIHRPCVLAVPKAWSWSLSDWIVQPLKNIVRPLLQRPIVRNRKQILYELERAD